MKEIYTQEEFINQAKGLIADINMLEIADHIGSGTLDKWIAGWSAAFKEVLQQLQYQEPGWINVKDKQPPFGEYVEVMIYDDLSDYPEVRVDVAWMPDSEIWISHDDVLCGDVVLWKPLAKPYPLQQMRKILEITKE